MEHWPTELHLPTEVWDRDAHDKWVSKGKLDATDRANAEVERLLAMVQREAGERLAAGIAAARAAAPSMLQRSSGRPKTASATTPWPASACRGRAPVASGVEWCAPKTAPASAPW